MIIRVVGNHRVEESQVQITSSDDMVPLPVAVVGDNTHSSPLVSAFQLGYQSPSRRYEDRARASRDLIAIGASSNASGSDSTSDPTVYFGIVMDEIGLSRNHFLQTLKLM